MSRHTPIPDGELQATVYLPNGQQNNFIYRATTADYEYMGLALEQATEALAAGDSPIGSVMVSPSGAHPTQTREFRDKDLTAHAEILAIRAVKEEVGRYLGQCMLYTTAEPCIGCAYALDKGQIGTLFVGASRDDAPDFFRRRDTLHTVWADTRRTLMVVRGLRSVEAAELLTANTKRH